MPKMKTKSSLGGRFKRTASGGIKRNGSKMRHILSTKPKKQKRRLKKAKMVSSADMKKLKNLMPY